MISTVLILLIIIPTVLLWNWERITKWRQYRKTIMKLPQAPMPALPLLGHSYLLIGTSTIFFHYVAQRTVLSLQLSRAKFVNCWLGPVPLLIVQHPEAAEVLFKGSKHIEKSFIYRFLHPWLGTGLLTASGEKWKQRRRLITPSFHFNILQDFLDVMNEQSQIMIKNLRNQKLAGEKIDLGKAITMCALDIICETAMGKTVNAQNDYNNNYVRSIYRVSELIVLRQRTPLFWPDFFFKKLKIGKEHDQLIKDLQSFTKSIILERKKRKNMQTSSSRRMAFLDVLLHTKTEDGQELLLTDLQEEVDTFMFEGHDTTAAAMNWATYLIGSHPDVQKRIHEELDSIFGDNSSRSITMDDLRKMKYLECVIKESLRLFPSVPMIGRVTTEDCEIDGCFVPKGTQALIFQYVIHHSPLVWEDPEVFDPERFTTDNSIGRHPYAYIPFAAGPRNCIGQRFALQEEKVLLTQILRNFRLKSHDRRKDIKMVGDLILRSAIPLNITLSER